MEETLSRRVLVALAVVVVIAIVAALAVFFVPVKGTPLYERFMLARSLTGLMLAEQGYESIAPRSFGVFGLKGRDIEVEGKLGDYVSVPGTEIAIVRSISGAQEIVRLSPDAQALVRDPSDKANLAVSEDGTRIAYASLSGEDASVHVLVWNREDGVVTDYGAGSAPQFFMRSGQSMLLFRSATGFAAAAICGPTACSHAGHTPSAWRTRSASPSASASNVPTWVKPIGSYERDLRICTNYHSNPTRPRESCADSRTETFDR